MTRRERWSLGAIGTASVIVGLGAFHLADQAAWLFLWLVAAGVVSIWGVFHAK